MEINEVDAISKANLSTRDVEDEGQELDSYQMESKAGYIVIYLYKGNKVYIANWYDWSPCEVLKIESTMKVVL